MHLDTRERQLKMWSDLFLSYAKSKGLYSMAVAELYTSPICHNTEINRRLSKEAIIQVIEWMSKNSNAEMLDLF